MRFWAIREQLGSSSVVLGSAQLELVPFEKENDRLRAFGLFLLPRLAVPGCLGVFSGFQRNQTTRNGEERWNRT